MSASYHVSRRRFLAQTSMGLLALGLPSWLNARPNLQDMPKLGPNKANANFKPDVELDLFCRPNSAQILPGAKTQVLQYTAKLINGPQDTLTSIPNSFLAPLVRLHKDQKVRIHLHNGLSESTITHWHGLHVPTVMDGQPQYEIKPGETYVYEFEVRNRASFNIIHPHPHGMTAKQVYHGLAGGLIVNDTEEAALELPSGEYEIPLVIQDKQFNRHNQLVYAQTMHDRMLGFYGDQVLVNGQVNFQLNVASRAYRLRFLNGSTARIYKLGWSDGTPLTVLGVDGGLLAKPETKPYLMLAPGERLDVWADFSGRKEGEQLILRSLPFSGVLPPMAERMMQGGMGNRSGMGRMGMMHASALPVGSDYPLLTVKVTRTVNDSPKLPTQLSSFKRYQLSDTANATHPVPIAISEGPMAMRLNGRAFAYDDVQVQERIPVNSLQLLEMFHAHGGGHAMDNAADTNHTMPQGMGRRGSMGMMGMEGGMGMMGMRHDRPSNHTESEDTMMNMGGMMGNMGGMMAMAHPIHLHGQSFQIVSRSIEASEAETAYTSVKEGFVDSGFKDTVLVMPGEKVRIIKPFEDFKGLFLYHCHNLEHEDLGMMRYFSVE